MHNTFKFLTNNVKLYLKHIFIIYNHCYFNLKVTSGCALSLFPNPCARYKDNRTVLYGNTRESNDAENQHQHWEPAHHSSQLSLPISFNYNDCNTSLSTEDMKSILSLTFIEKIKKVIRVIFSTVIKK